MSLFNSVMEKHRQFLMAARIQVETVPTVDSTEGLSLISSIEDIKDYLQNHIILKISGATVNCKAVPPYFEDNKSA